jgi:hypothetical protein
MGMQPVGINTRQPGAQLRQLLEQGDIAAAMVRRRVQGQPPCGRQQRLEFRAEAPRGGRPQLDPGRQRPRPLQQMRALTIADQHQLH